MNGYVACQKICELYDKDRKFFEMQQRGDIWDEINQRPLLIACTGFLNDKIEEEAKLSGFDLAIQAPLSQEKINKYIRERLDAKSAKKALLKNSFNIQKESKEEEKIDLN